MIEHISFCHTPFAIIVRNSFRESGITFFTPNDYSQQLAYMSHPEGKKIQPHVHKKVQCEAILGGISREHSLDCVLEGKVECLGGEITDDVGEVSSPESTHALLGIYAGEAVADTGVTRHFTRLDHRISILVNSTRR